MLSVVVIGAGVVGASAAYRLAAGGARVTVVEAGQPGRETTGRSFAWLNANEKPPLPYHRLNAGGIEAHQRLKSELGGAPWLHETGMLRLVGDGEGDALARHVEELRGLEYPAEIVYAARARELEPAVRWPDGAAIAHFPGEGWADGPALAAALIEAATARGAVVRPWTRVVAIEPTTSGVRVRVEPVDEGTGAWPRRAAGVPAASGAAAAAGGAATAASGGERGAREGDAGTRGVDEGMRNPRGGRVLDAPEAGSVTPAGPSNPSSGAETIEADCVVVAAGRFSEQVARLAGARVEQAPTCGLLALTSPVADGPTRISYLPGIHLRPDGGGRLLLQDNDTDDQVTPDTPESPDLPGCHLLLERAQAYVPALAAARIDGARVGIRSLPADGYPVIGRAPGQEQVYLAVTHSGMTMGPLIGEITAAELLTGALDPRVATFRPDRFAVRQ